MTWAFLGGLICGGTLGALAIALVANARRKLEDQAERCIWCGGTGRRPPLELMR